MSEKVFDKENWKREAESVIDDIKNHVKNVEISKLQSTDRRVHLNVTTLENENYCVELSGHGFRVVGKARDTFDVIDGEYYETPYSLLSKISLNFYQSFGNELMSKLHAVNHEDD